MADAEDPMEVLLQKHKKEKKELQGKIQSLKKRATKGDVKKKKGVQEEIAHLEQELLARHNKEIQDLKEKSNFVDVIEGVENVEINERPIKVSKAQKRRDKKAAEQREREKRIQEQEVMNETGDRHVESEKIKNKLKNMGLMIYEIPADGNCLYNAVDHQLKFSQGVKWLRLNTGNHIREHKDDYLPFLSMGEVVTDEEFDEYCDKIIYTTNWGGEIELKALSHVVKRPITVIQADGPPLVMGEQYKCSGDNITVTYHRHIYRLGEHYNSVQPYREEDL